MGHYGASNSARQWLRCLYVASFLLRQCVPPSYTLERENPLISSYCHLLAPAPLGQCVIRLACSYFVVLTHCFQRNQRQSRRSEPPFWSVTPIPAQSKLYYLAVLPIISSTKWDFNLCVSRFKLEQVHRLVPIIQWCMGQETLFCVLCTMPCSSTKSNARPPPKTSASRSSSETAPRNWRRNNAKRKSRAPSSTSSRRSVTKRCVSSRLVVLYSSLCGAPYIVLVPFDTFCALVLRIALRFFPLTTK